MKNILITELKIDNLNKLNYLIENNVIKIYENYNYIKRKILTWNIIYFLKTKEWVFIYDKKKNKGVSKEKFKEKLLMAI